MPSKSPARPSADPTRKKIVKAAQKLFAQQGFAGTSISDIAGKAKINQSLIYHHFGSKMDLWQHVKKTLCETCFALTVEDLSPEAKTFRDFIQQFIAARFKFYNDNPEVRRMILWERLEIQARKYSKVSETESEILDRFATIIRSFQARGEIRKELEPNLVLIFLMSSGFSLFLAEHTPMLAVPEEKKQVLKKRYLDMVTDSLWRALAPNPQN